MKNLNFGLCVAGATLASSAVMFAVKPAQAASLKPELNIWSFKDSNKPGSWIGGTLTIDTDGVVSEFNGSVEGYQIISLYDAPVVPLTSGGFRFEIENYNQYTYSQAFKLFKAGPGHEGGEDALQFISGPYASLPSATRYGTFSYGAVPEPLTILGSITAAGFGVAFKRKLAKSKKDEKDA
jgi:hypothetical protein